MNFVFTWNFRITLLKVERDMAKVKSMIFMNRMDSLWINLVACGLVSRLP